MFQQINTVVFPEPQSLKVNMMPIIMGELDSLPQELQGYQDMIMATQLKHQTVVYLTVHESMVEKGSTQRRPGIHTDATSKLGWGTGWGGGTKDKGIYLASSDGRCRVWNYLTQEVDEMGALEAPNAPSVVTEPNMMYWMTDRTPHESLPCEKTGTRQFFRLVSDEISAWFSQHNTPNPLGVQPTCPIIHTNKFKA